jgi:hypothetical protein
MAIITLKYNKRNKNASRMIELLVSSGLVSVQKTGLDEALEDVAKGRVYRAENAKDLVKKCLK